MTAELLQQLRRFSLLPPRLAGKKPGPGCAAAPASPPGTRPMGRNWAILARSAHPGTSALAGPEPLLVTCGTPEAGQNLFCFPLMSYGEYELFGLVGAVNQSGGRDRGPKVLGCSMVRGEPGLVFTACEAQKEGGAEPLGEQDPPDSLLPGSQKVALLLLQSGSDGEKTPQCVCKMLLGQWEHSSQAHHANLSRHLDSAPSLLWTPGAGKQSPFCWPGMATGGGNQGCT